MSGGVRFVPIKENRGGKSIFDARDNEKAEVGGTNFKSERRRRGEEDNE